MRTFSFDVPAMALIGVAIALIIALIFLYLFASFLHAWVTKRSFSQAITVLEEKTEKVGRMIAAPFMGGVQAVSKLFSVCPFKNGAEFFAWFAAADLEVWREMPSPVRKKRTTFGMLMFGALALTSALAGRVWGDIFHSTTAGVVIAFAWFAAIWSLDRAVISFMDADNKGAWKMLAARLLMVAAISYVNTSFVAMEIYDTEIKQQIASNKQKEINHLSDSVNVVRKSHQADRDQLQKEEDAANTAYLAWANEEQAKIDAQSAQWNADKQRFIEEVAGNVGSGKRGWGDAAKAAFAIAQTDSANLQDMIVRFDSVKTLSPAYVNLQSAKKHHAERDAEIIKDIETLDAYLAAENAKVLDRKQDGYGDRTDAMWQQAGKRPFSFFMVFMLFFTFEAMAVLMKLMSGKDNYDEAIRLKKGLYAADRQYEAAENLQTKSNVHSSAMDNLINTSITQQTTANVLRKGLLDELHGTNIDRISQVQKHLAEIEAQTAGIVNEEEREIVRKSLTASLMKTFVAN